ncbi:MAG: M23 family metallopeptidase [Candidatus Mcinerneyibacterium aminivorans]|jgi:murein DD-endopeptidase MepM/ murein hydrolase activator NlpD|uniref:M23 family metallopeptidase n=1 Tax=Candidatus Mcinerneyibacterium aminivorans TaxID=2703815 RepID=A0A5D0MKN8_9BACT|nr:MAG: M23 family metallopeptidase [Candidatus Mcinerneyibacterium aminivorans]
MEDKKKYHILFVSEDCEDIKRYKFSRKKFRFWATLVSIVVSLIIFLSSLLIFNYISVLEKYKPIKQEYNTVLKQNLELKKKNDILYNKLREAKFDFAYWKKNTTDKIEKIKNEISYVSRLYNLDKPMGGIKNEEIVNEELIKKMLDEGRLDIFNDISQNIKKEMNSYDWILSKEQNYILDTYIYKQGFRFAYPVDNPLISSYFGKRWDPLNGYYVTHRGVDFRGSIGEPIFAAESGYVQWAGTVSQYGNLIILKHSRYLTSRYAHLNSFAVKTGQRIKKGDLIGFIGSSGRVTGEHLHFEVRINGEVINPLSILQKR